MTIPAYPSVVTLSDLQAEFGGANPISLSEYYAGGALVPAGTIGYPNGVAQAIPSRGTISLNDFRGAVRYVPGAIDYAAPGTYYFTVPQGIYSIKQIEVNGAGGGGGGCTGGGDNHAGGGGGSGGYTSSYRVPVTPGQSIQIVVGAGGKKGQADFNHNIFCAGTSGSNAGSQGGASVVLSTGLYAHAGGGGGGWYSNSDNCGAYSGAGGTGDVVGAPGAAVNCNRNHYGPTPGGARQGQIYGKGGQSHGNPGTGQCTTEGGHGFVRLVW